MPVGVAGDPLEGAREIRGAEGPAAQELLLGAERAQTLFDAAWSLDEAPDVTDLLGLTRP